MCRNQSICDGLKHLVQQISNKNYSHQIAIKVFKHLNDVYHQLMFQLISSFGDLTFSNDKGIINS